MLPQTVYGKKAVWAGVSCVAIVSLAWYLFRKRQSPPPKLRRTIATQKEFWQQGRESLRLCLWLWDQQLAHEEESSESYQVLLAMRARAFALLEESGSIDVAPRAELNTRQSLLPAAPLAPIHSIHAPASIFGSEAVSDDEEFHDALNELESPNLLGECFKLATLGRVPIRTYWLRETGCNSNEEFAAKVHALRLAGTALFLQRDRRVECMNLAKSLGGGLLQRCGRDSAAFEASIDELDRYLEGQREAGFVAMHNELREKQVQFISLYDVLLDFTVLDSFVLLDDPPAFVTSVLRNGWIANALKTKSLDLAIGTAVRRKIAGCAPDSFLLRFYIVCEQISPLLARGYLVDDGSNTHTLCVRFHDALVDLVVELFKGSVNDRKWSSIDCLAQDMHTLILTMNTQLAGYLRD